MVSASVIAIEPLRPLNRNLTSFTVSASYGNNTNIKSILTFGPVLPHPSPLPSKGEGGGNPKILNAFGLTYPDSLNGKNGRFNTYAGKEE
jgi:hypothetical protein